MTSTVHANMVFMLVFARRVSSYLAHIYVRHRMNASCDRGYVSIPRFRTVVSDSSATHGHRQPLILLNIFFPLFLFACSDTSFPAEGDLIMPGRIGPSALRPSLPQSLLDQIDESGGAFSSTTSASS